MSASATPITNRLSPQAALVLAFEAVLAMLLVDHPISLAALALAAGGYALGGGSWKHVAGALALAVLGTWTVVVSQGLFYQGWPRTALFQVVPPNWFPFADPPGLYVFREGLVHGLIQSLRFDVMILVSAGLLARYATDELTGALLRFRLPAALAFLFSMALRYLPLMVDEMRQGWLAFRLRGIRPWGRKLLVPLLAGNVRRADEIGMALAARGVVLWGEPRRFMGAQPPCPGSKGLPSWRQSAVGVLLGRPPHPHAKELASQKKPAVFGARRVLWAVLKFCGGAWKNRLSGSDQKAPKRHSQPLEGMQSDLQESMQAGLPAPWSAAEKALCLMVALGLACVAGLLLLARLERMGALSLPGWEGVFNWVLTYV